MARNNNVNIRISGATTLIAELGFLSEMAEDKTDEHLDAFAEKLLGDIQRTAPVDTGRYRDDWTKEKPEKGVRELINDVPYARHLVFPNSRMTGSPNADVPSEGITHNVRGLVFGRKTAFKDEYKVKLNSGLDS